MQRREKERKKAWAEEEEKTKKKFWRLTSFLRAARKRLEIIRQGQTKVQVIKIPPPDSSTDGKWTYDHVWATKKSHLHLDTIIH